MPGRSRRCWTAVFLLAAACGGGSAFFFSFTGLWQGELDLTADDCGVQTGNLNESHEVMQSGSAVTLQIGDSLYTGMAGGAFFSVTSSFPACCVDGGGHPYGHTTRYESYDYRRINQGAADVTFTQEFRGGCHPGCRRVWQGTFQR